MRITLVLTAAIFLFAAPAARAAAVQPARPGGNRASVLSVADVAVRDSMPLRGTPYAWGGTTPAGFDCSGFTRYVFARVGIHLAHSSYAQWTAGRHVPRRDLRPGDLVFFAGLGHVGIYVGGGRFIHAPHAGTVVSIDRLSGSWYGREYDGAVRMRGSSAAVRRVLRRPGAGTMPAWRYPSTPDRSSARALPAASRTS
jgi:cell wall-associated NlpC family hydrolase